MGMGVCCKWFIGKGADDDLHRKWCRNGAEIVKQRRGFLSYETMGLRGVRDANRKAGPIATPHPWCLSPSAAKPLEGRLTEAEREAKARLVFLPPADRMYRRASVAKQCLQGFRGLGSVTPNGFVTLAKVGLIQCSQGLARWHAWRNGVPRCPESFRGW
jgi:hypothetical protein